MLADSLNTKILDDPLYHLMLCNSPHFAESTTQGRSTTCPTRPAIFVWGTPGKIQRQKNMNGTNSNQNINKGPESYFPWFDTTRRRRYIWFPSETDLNPPLSELETISFLSILFCFSFGFSRRNKVLVHVSPKPHSQGSLTCLLRDE